MGSRDNQDDVSNESKADLSVNYSDFLARKAITAPAAGIASPPALSGHLFPFQADIVRWGLRRGRAAIFAGTGLGKTAMQLEWAHRVAAHTRGPVLVLAPLAVAQQTIAEGARWGIPVAYAADATESTPTGITITNYDRLDKFAGLPWAGVVLDESSILKAYDGKTRTAILEEFRRTPFKLACTATPAPNDYMELGNHAEFLGVMTRAEMLSMFFVHDGGDTSEWRLKGHAEADYWRWVCSWAVMIRMPSDLGYEDGGYVLPPLEMHQHTVAATADQARKAGRLFADEARTLVERRDARKASIAERVAIAARLVNESGEPWLVWCNLNAEGDALAAAIPDAVQVAGSDSPEDKTARMLGFAAGKHRVLISKPSICGYGMNWQHCPNVAFVGLSDSWEQFYQAVRRCWRFGQTRPVHCHVITAETEGAVVANIQRKEEQAEAMVNEMVRNMADITSEEIRGAARESSAYQTDRATGDGWALHLGDCVDVVRSMPDESIHYSIFSPPFASLYTYSNSDRDMGNSKSHAEFYEHFGFLLGDLLRVTKPGRLLSFHCMNLPTSKAHDGFIGIADFRGILIRAFVEAGWIYHSEVCIWKDPVTAMQRTKALGLLYKQLRKDSCMSRQGIADYLVTMRKPGENPERVTHTPDEFPVEVWQRYASPVWMDINPSDTLQRESAREDRDEKHICPLQLDVVRRALKLWTNPGDTVLSPFAGIGSEGYVALQEGRRFVGAELKRSYWEQARRNLTAAARNAGRQSSLFEAVAP